MHRAWVALAAGVIVSGAVLTGMGNRGASTTALGLGDPDLVETQEASPSPSAGGLDNLIMDVSPDIGVELDGPAVAFMPSGGIESVRVGYVDVVGWGDYTQMGMSYDDVYKVGSMNVRLYTKKDFVRAGGRFRLEFDTTWNKGAKEASASCTLKGPWGSKDFGAAKDCSAHFVTWEGLSIKTKYDVTITAYDTNGVWMQWFGGFTTPDPDEKFVSTYSPRPYWCINYCPK